MAQIWIELAAAVVPACDAFASLSSPPRSSSPAVASRVPTYSAPSRELGRPSGTCCPPVACESSLSV